MEDNFGDNLQTLLVAAECANEQIFEMDYVQEETVGAVDGETSLSDTNPSLEEIETYQCEVCLQNYDSESLLQSHSCKITCLKCDKSPDFLLPDELVTHLTFTHSCSSADSNISCGVCDRTFPSFAFESHAASHLRNSLWLCWHCKLSLATYSETKTHLKLHKLTGKSFQFDKSAKSTKKKVFPCPECDKIFVRRVHLENHMNRHSGIKPHFCAACEMTFTSTTALKKHQKCVHNSATENTFQCEFCAKSFLRKRFLAQHLRQHLGEESADSALANQLRRIRFGCSFCEKVLDSQRLLEEHEAKHRSGQITVYKCSQCDAEFGSEAATRRHLEQHDRARSWVCGFCNLDCQSHEEYERHRKLEHNVHYECEFCAESFDKSAPLRTHLRTVHHDLLPFYCDVCGLSVATETALNSHVAQHSPSQRVMWHCADCGQKTFASYQEYLGHRIKVHKTQACVCGVCGTEFTRKSNLRRHERAAHRAPRANLSCQNCGVLFTHANYLVKHMVKVHDMDPESEALKELQKAVKNDCEVQIVLEKDDDDEAHVILENNDQTL